MTDEEITDIIENNIRFGKISKIEHVHKNGKFLSVFVYFQHVVWSPKTVEVLTSITNGNSYKIYIDQKVYWIARQKCINYNIIQLLVNRILKMEEMIETQNLQIGELMTMVKKEHNDYNDHNEHNDDLLCGDNNFFYISDTPSSSSSNDSLFNF